VNGRGDSVIAWRFYPHHPQRVRASVAPAGHGFGRPVTVSGPAGQVRTLRVALSPAGDALVAWAEFRTVRRGKELFAGSSRLWSSLRVRGGRFTRPTRLPTTAFASFGGVALGPRAHAAGVWSQAAGIGSTVFGAVYR
jgi:hypothetical protein